MCIKTILKTNKTVKINCKKNKPSNENQKLYLKDSMFNSTDGTPYLVEIRHIMKTVSSFSNLILVNRYNNNSNTQNT